MAELSYIEKVTAIEDALQKGMAALLEAQAELERKDALIGEMTELAVSYMHLIRSDYEGRNGLMGQMEGEYRKVVAALDTAREMGFRNV